MIALALPCLPPRKNVVRRARLSKSGKIYMVGGGEVEKFLLVVRAAVNKAQAAQPINKSKLKVEVWFTFPSAHHDIDGPLYCLLDCLAAALGFNDLQVVELRAYKVVERDVRRTYVEVSEL